MQKIIFTLLFVLAMFTGRAQITILSVTPDTFCAGAVLTVTIHVGIDSALSIGNFRPVSTKGNYVINQIDSSITTLDSTMLGQTVTLHYNVISTTTDTLLFLTKAVSSGYVPYFNSDTFHIFENLYTPDIYTTDSALIMLCPNSTTTISTTSSWLYGSYVWTTEITPVDYDTVYGQSVTVPFNDTLWGQYYCRYIVNGCSSIKLFYIAQKYSPTQDVCVVTLDSTLTHNVIIWDKTQTIDTSQTPLIDSFFIIRNSQKISSQPFSAFSSYTDFNADISLQAWTYSITVFDGCGLEGAGGNIITTMFQEQPNNGDVTWYPYMEGSNAISTTYSVLREAGGSSNWTLLDTVTAVSSPITIHDTSTTIPLNTKYRVEANGGSCVPRSAYTIYSNVGVVGATGINSISSDLIEIYPNPATNMIHLPKGNLHLILSDVTGQKVDEVFNSGTTLDVSWLTPGVYFLTYDAHTVKLVKL